MKKIVFAIMLALTLGFAGCNTPEATETNTTEAPVEATVEVGDATAVPEIATEIVDAPLADTPDAETK